MSQSHIDRTWFREVNTAWDGYSVSLGIEEILYDEKSKYQDIMVFKSTSFGNVLVLDGTIQCTERDEFTYQEMISHLPLNSHPNPVKVLVIGGGDGGVVREVLKYSSVENVTLCEIDEKVIEVSKQFIPSMSSCLSDPRVTIHCGDGISYVTEHTEEFDVIITDASDPVGPAEGLYELTFYEKLKNALRPDGVICCQGETPWFDLPLIKNVIGYCRQCFPTVEYALGNTPTYTGGSIGYILCGTNPARDLKIPIRHFNDVELDAMNIKYYSPEIHQSAFVLPRFVKKVLTEEVNIVI
ncbi:spermidine synthase-like isoform X1 [Gigantopelta aegis]|uniref:spermidine synthase-like isoform X1 n=1 Tax=Gigantopelta aegis TaxID=1735272 RepID=UPI001B88CCF1|nr:spermidine synthase-like isoform X1 [Gigantopelta aegis]